jgi:hypothetical protein
MLFSGNIFDLIISRFQFCVVYHKFTAGRWANLNHRYVSGVDMRSMICRMMHNKMVLKLEVSF